MYREKEEQEEMFITINSGQLLLNFVNQNISLLTQFTPVSKVTNHSTVHGKNPL